MITFSELVRKWRGMLIVPLAVVLQVPLRASGWSECGHHLVALIAYDLLKEPERAAVRRLIAEHPRAAKDFLPPDGIADQMRWRVGLVGYWPDIARTQPEYDRPSWHYQLGASRVVGDIDTVTVPETPGPPPDGVTLDTQELHIAQALVVCRRALADRGTPPSDRALALCWTAHLVGDAHQPCHAGSLYASGLFPEGDRGANRIELHRGRNLHALWDGLLGQRFDEADVRRRLHRITGREDWMSTCSEAANEQDPLVWLAESRALAVHYVYAREILGPIKAVVDGRADSLPTLDPTDYYLKRAGELARQRVCMAGHRLAKLWSECLSEPDTLGVESVGRSERTP